MSKGGGAGKVYFVLYLAVVLELLIIIVERDEAEQGLLRKQKMKIVESILSQLQSGAGTEGINTRPQDEITILDKSSEAALGKGVTIKSSRKYIIEVGVTDIAAEIKRKDKEGESEKDYALRLKKLIELGNVSEMQYQIFFNPSQDANVVPQFPSEEDLKKDGIDFLNMEPGGSVKGPDGSEWKFLSLSELNLDKETTFGNIPSLSNVTLESIQPIYPADKRVQKGPFYEPPQTPPDSSFFYSHEETNRYLGKSNTGDLKKRSFVVNFQPPSNAGWYKLRFASRTNRILGVRADVTAAEPPDETTINIGTVQLTVKDLKKVNRELISKLEKYNLPPIEVLTKEHNLQKFDDMIKTSIENASHELDNAAEAMSKVKLYGYIAKLLAPGQSVNFAQNKGAIEFNIRVITPKPTVADPTVTGMGDIASFDQLPPVFEFTISPYQKDGNKVDGKIVDASGATVARVLCQPSYQLDPSMPQPVLSGKCDYRGTAEKALSPGKYKIIITHAMLGKSKDETTDLEVFETKLTDGSVADIKNRLSAYGYYGNNVYFTAEPTSGSKIAGDQFRIYLSTDADQQKPPVYGLTATGNNALSLVPQANKIFARVTWVQPFTKMEKDLLPLQTFDIKQESPKISDGGKSIAPSGTERKIRVKVTGIQVSAPATGDASKKAEITVRVGKLNNKVGGYEIQSEAQVDREVTSTGVNVSVSFDMTGSLGRGEDKVKGTVIVPVIVKCVNPVNGKESDEKTKNVEVKINYAPEQERRGRGR